MEDEDGVPMPKEPPPYDVVGQKCYGCVTLKEENAEVGDAHQGAVHFFFTRHKAEAEGTFE